MKIDDKRRKELAILKASNEMLSQSINETLLRGNDEEADLIKNAMKENGQMLENLGYSQEDLKDIEYTKVSKKYVDSYNKRKNKNNNIEEETYEKKEENLNDISIKEDYSILNTEGMDGDIQYDIIPLPSNGETYKNKKSRIPVSFLTASDENIITSPNLYRDGKVVDIILKRKILDKDINPDLLCKGDRDAILVWLRATGYGPEFPIKVHDDETNTDFDAVVNLSNIKYKDFKLKSDENGNFDYTTKNGDLIKFKFLDRTDEISLNKMMNEDNLNMKKFKLIRSLSDIKIELSEDNSLSKNEKNKLIGSIKTIQDWINKIDTNDEVVYEKSITNMMKLTIVSINGLSDKKYIEKYINKMPSIEAFKFRKYVMDNEPGLDLNIEIERPENLGGGSIKTFLVIDPSIFINIA